MVNRTNFNKCSTILLCGAGKPEYNKGRMDVRAVITDFGGVLYNPPDLRWLRRWQIILDLINDDLANQMFTPDAGLVLL